MVVLFTFSSNLMSFNITRTLTHALHCRDCWVDPTQRTLEHIDPTKGFKPERWLGEKGFKKPSAFEYVPFGVGSRSCVGSTLATTEIKVREHWILNKY